jgi:transposase
MPEALDAPVPQGWREGLCRLCRPDGAPVIDPHTSEVLQAQIFIGVLGASNYTYAEAQESQELFNWISAHVRMFAFFGGAPEIVVPDNLKAGVKHPCRYEPDLNPTYQDLARALWLAVIPTRVRKPKDKAKAEVGVQVVERWILARLRNRTFFIWSI